MKPTRTMWIAALGSAGVLVGSAIIWHQQKRIAELESRNLEAGRTLIRSTQERTELEQQLKRVEVRAIDLEKQIEQSRKNTNVALSPAANRARSEGEQVGASVATNQWIEEANNPDVMRRLTAQARAPLERRFGPLLQQLNLTPEQNAQFIKLLADKRQAPLDVAAASHRQGDDPLIDPLTYQAMIKETRGEIEDQIHSLLGDANYERYLEFNRGVGLANVMGLFDQVLRSTDAPLTDEQTRRFQRLMLDNETNRITGKVVAASKDFLSAAQVQALEDLRAIQQANARKRNQPRQILPTTVTSPVTGK